MTWIFFYVHNKICFSSVCTFWQKVQFPNTLQIKRWLHKVLLSHIEHTCTPLSTSLTQKHISCHFPIKYTHSLWFWQNCHAWRPYSRQRSNKESERAMDGWMGGDGGVCVCHLVSEHKWHWGGGKVGWWRGRGKIRQQSGHLFLHSQSLGRRLRANVAMSLAIQNGVWLNNLRKKRRCRGRNGRVKSTERQKKKRLNTPKEPWVKNLAQGHKRRVEGAFIHPTIPLFLSSLHSSGELSVSVFPHSHPNVSRRWGTVSIAAVLADDNTPTLQNSLRSSERFLRISLPSCHFFTGTLTFVEPTSKLALSRVRDVIKERREWRN